MKPEKENIRINREIPSVLRQAVMEEMASFDGNAFEPQVGIFWLDTEKEELFDVRAVPVASLREGISTIAVLHKDIWAKNYYRAKARGNTDSIYLKDYTQIPRGRVFVNRSDGKFSVKVGHWIDDYEAMLTPLIREEFNIQTFEYDIDEHWDLGNGWSEHDFSSLGM